ncbi:response regulator transcription factor [Frigoribacterium sp. CFBP9039]|uniref:response regulator transcription factor n=1 Tax=unclassified Frigoribacterium TaxID=2627005 RepID=UPI00177DD3C7|nr:response regulator [Frigoribacterium sp. CFBP9039]MBD8702835.1 response regulator transcription factor [Frigoribacterium sp. CFBP 13712]MDY0947069.1 response regulator transcription factor [Frigoribacterium sp. CFBP9039]
MHVLLVEDDPAIAGSLREGLARYGYEVDWVTTGREALAADAPGVVLLDLGLPDMDGLDVCRRLRARSNVPIIVVTARGDEVDTVAGLEVGADDYVAKPFGVREIVARIRAVTRRHATDATGEGTEPAPPPVRLGTVTIDVAARRVTQGDAEIALAPKEFDLLVALARRVGSVVTREALIDEVWDTHWFGSTRTLDVHVSALRQKLGAAVAITTVRGVGFRVEHADAS